MALSDLAVRQAKATGTVYTLGDFDGLSLNVSPHGGKSWHFCYYWQGRQKRISLGTYPEVGLREARQARDEARVLLSKGANPKVHRQQKRLADRLADGNTFGVVFNQWVEHRKLEIKTGKGSTHAKMMRVCRKDVLPFLEKQPIHEIKRLDLLDVVARIERRDALVVARHVRGWLKQVFRYALVKVPELEYNPAADLDVVAVPQRPKRHHPYLRMDELPALLRTLRAYRNGLVQRGLRLLLLTGVRTSELRYATPGQFDLEHGLWVVPPENVKQLQQKMRKVGQRPQDMPPYVVPLSTQAVEIVRELLDWRSPGQRYLLAHRSDPGKCISTDTLNGALRQRMDYAGRLTGHGLRGTLSTALNEIGYRGPGSKRNSRTATGIKCARPTTMPITSNRAGA